MRPAFWALLLVNLILLFVWGSGFFAGGEEGREPQRLEHQLNSEQLRIVARSELPAPAAVAEATKRALLCKRITGLEKSEADSLVKAVEGLQDWQILVIPEKPQLLHWVVIPGLANRVAAEKKREELRLLGVQEHQVVEHATFGPFAVSLAQFADESAATDAFQKLQRKNVRSARIVMQDASPKSAAELRAPAQMLFHKLPDLAALFPATSVGECSVP